MNEFGEMYRPFVDVKVQYGAVGDGHTDDYAAIQAGLDSIGAGRVYIPPGRYLVASPLIVRDGIKIVGAGPKASIIIAGADGMTLIHHVGSDGGAEGIGLSGSQRKHVSGIRIAPLDEQRSGRVHQNYNHFRDLAIEGCAEGIVLQCGPETSDGASGCWYNCFQSVHVYYCTRGIWLKDGPGPRSSGVNRNQFFSVRVGQGTNTGLQIDSGDTNSFFGCSFEGIATGESPNETPTAIKIAADGMYSGSNQSNRFFGVQCEGCTRDLENANRYTEMYGAYVRTALYSAVPQVMVGGYEGSVVPQVLPGIAFQTNGQVPGLENTAVALPFGRLQFPERRNPSDGTRTLDAYEEGTWSPVLAAVGGIHASYDIQSGRYVKIGRHVFFWGHLKLSGLSSEDSRGCNIDGLPYAADSVDAVVTIRWNGLRRRGAGMPLSAILRAGTSRIDIQEQSANSVEPLLALPTSGLTSAAELHVSGQYVTKS